MKKLVIDSSVIVKWLNKADERHLDQADLILSDLEKGEISLFSSCLAKYEVGNALLVKKKLSLRLFKKAIDLLYLLPITYIEESSDLAYLTYRFGIKYDITYYDASFAAIAKHEKASLVTDNPKHQEKVREIDVIPLREYRLT